MLTGCNAAGKVEVAINHIGSVSLESRERIEKVEALYNSLPAEKRASVSNYNTLVAARKEYDRLNTIVWRAYNTVNAIGAVTKDSGGVILEAMEAMDVLEAEALGAYAENLAEVLLQARIDFASAGCDAGEQCLSAGDYQQAYTYFSTVNAVGATADTISRVDTGLANVMVGYADILYRSGDLEQAMYYLDESRQTYGRDTDEAVQLREKLEKKLYQQRPYTGKEIKNTLR